MSENFQVQAVPFSINQLIDRRDIHFQQFMVAGLCLIFNMIDGFDITALAVTAQAIGDEMGLSADKLGLVFSFSLAGMMIGAIFLAPIADVYGRRTMLICTLVVVGASVLLTAYTEALWQLLTLRLVSGLGAGAMLASQATLTSEYSPARFRALAVAVVVSGYPLGAMTTGLVAGFIIPDFGWRGMFLAGGIVTLSLSLIAFFLLPESMQFLCKCRPGNALERFNAILKRFGVEAVEALPTLEGDSTQIDKPAIGKKMIGLLQSEYRKITLVLWAAFFMCFVTLYFLMSWTPKLITNAGYSSGVGNYAFSLFNFGGVLGVFVLGALSTRWMLSTVISVFLAGAAIFMLVFALVDSAELVLVLIFVVGLLLNGGFSGLYAAAAKAYPTQIRSTGVGWGIGIGRFGAVLAPAAAGIMIVNGFNLYSSFVVFAIPAFFAAVLAYRLRLQ